MNDTYVVRASRRRRSSAGVLLALGLMLACASPSFAQDEPSLPPLDTTPPVVTLEGGPARDVTNEPGATFSFRSDEDPAVAFTCTLNGTEIPACASPLSVTGAEGRNELSVVATDAMGNAGAASRSWTLDTAAPRIEVDASVGPDPEADAAFTIRAPDEEVEFVDCALTQTRRAVTRPVEPCSDGRQTFLGVGGEPLTFTVRAVDAAGNETLATQSLAWPDASFAIRPTTLLVGEPVTLTATDTDGAHLWSLDGDRSFDDGEGSTVTRAYATPGAREVALRVRNAAGAQSTRFDTITMLAPPPADPAPSPNGPASPAPGSRPSGPLSPAPPTAFAAPAARPPSPPPVTRSQSATRAPRPALLRPFPVVRIAGEVFRTHARVRLLTVLTPRGGRLEVRCRGRSCPFRVVRRTASSRASRRGTLVRVRELEGRRLDAGVVLEIRVTAPGTIGKYTRLRIRGAGRAPARRDGCLLPRSSRPVACSP